MFFALFMPNLMPASVVLKIIYQLTVTAVISCTEPPNFLATIVIPALFCSSVYKRKQLIRYLLLIEKNPNE